jgi:hypothetical protein
VVSTSFTPVQQNTPEGGEADCPAGQVAIGGGYNGYLVGDAYAGFLVLPPAVNGPNSGDTGWVVEWEPNVPGILYVIYAPYSSPTVTVYAVCANAN